MTEHEAHYLIDSLTYAEKLLLLYLLRSLSRQAPKRKEVKPV